MPSTPSTPRLSASRSPFTVALTGFALLAAGCGGAGSTSSGAAVTGASAPEHAAPASISEAGSIPAMRGAVAPLRSEHGAFTGGAAHYGLRIASDGAIRFVPRIIDEHKGPLSGAPVELVTVSVARGGRETLAGATAAAARRADRIQIERGAVEEILEPLESGLEQSWRFEKAPAGEGDLVVRVRASGQRFRTEAADGLHFADDNSPAGVRYGAATWIDASGHKTDVHPSFRGGEIVLAVPAAVLAASTFPAVLDPTVSAEVATDGANQGTVRTAIACEPGSTFCMVVWNALSNGQQNLFGAFVPMSGATPAPNAPFAITNLATSGNIQPAATYMTGQSKYAVAYQNSGTIKVAMFARSGVTIGAITSVNAGSGQQPAIATDGSNLVVAWSTAGGNLGVNAINATTATAAASVNVSAAAVGATVPAVASSGTNAYIVLWTESTDIFKSMITTAFAPAPSFSSTAKAALISAANTQQLPAVDFDGANYFAVWEDTRNATTDVFGARISTAGNSLDGTGVVISGDGVGGAAAGNQTAVAVAYDSTSAEHVVIWQDTRNAATTPDILAAQVKTAGGITVVDAAGFNVSAVAGSETQPRVGASPNLFLASYTTTREVVRFISAPKANGATCTAAGDCTSGFCSDGVCCNSACSGSCDVCAAALGAVADGTCTIVAAGNTGSPTCSPYVCSGVSPSCPTTCTNSAQCSNGFTCNAANQCVATQANGTACTAANQCASGFCVDGVCCNNACGGGVASDCQACNLQGAVGTCANVSQGVVCRASTGVCDLAESCTGVGPACPADAFQPNTTVCRASAGTCDTAETCTGNSANCPADAKVAAGTQCRGSAGACDVAESCDGTSNSCPVDAFVTAGTQCRAAAGACDVAESCSGTAAACPADTFVAAGTQCRAAAGACDVAESCSGASAACPADTVVAAGTTCRAAANSCDLAERCDGTSTACPADQGQPAGTACNDGNACTRTDTCQANNGTVLDANYDGSGGTFVDVNGISDVWQSFTAVGSGVLHSFTFVKTNTTTNATVRFKIFAGEGTGGALLYDSINPVAVTDATGTQTMTLTPALAPSIAAGTQYTFDLIAGAGVVTFRYANNSTYGGGVLKGVVYNNGNVNNPTTLSANTRDAVFQVFLTGPPSVCVGGNPVTCTASDQCHNVGTCDTATGVCSNPNKANGSACTDGNACTQTDTCQAGVCTGMNPVVCTALDQCHDAGTCNMATGMCSNPNKANGTVCNDNNACTTGDVCENGACAGPGQLDCNDGNTCTTDSCSAANGCQHQNLADNTQCNDGNACTRTDTCQTVAGTEVQDASYDGAGATGGTVESLGINDIWQSFDAVNTGSLTGFALFKTSNSNNFTAQFKILAGEGTGGAVLYQSPGPVAVPNGQGFVTFAIPYGAVAVTAGAQYTFEIFGTNASQGNMFTFRYYNGSNYGGGQLKGEAYNNANINNPVTLSANTRDAEFHALVTLPASACVGGNSVVCTASDQCHVAGACDPQNGMCSNPNAADGTTCNDGQMCTLNAACNNGACMRTQTVQPTIICPPDVTVPTQPNVCGAMPNLGQPTTDNCNGMEMVGNDSPGFFPFGTTTVTWTVTDGQGRSVSCTQNVTVENLDPVVQVMARTVAADGQCMAFADINAGSFDPDGGPLNCFSVPAAPYPLGVNNVTLICTDPCGGVGVGIANVTVVDSTPPTVMCPADQTLECADDGQFASYTPPQPQDNCPGARVQCMPQPGTFIAIGNNTVNCVATDAAGNSAMCSFQENVVDTMLPTIQCPPPVSVMTAPGTCGAAPPLGQPTADDSCGVASVTNDSPGNFGIGTTIVTWTVTDRGFHRVSCTQSVTVSDGEDPTITCPPDVTVTADPGACQATHVALGTPTTHDNCAAAATNNAPNAFPVGTTQVTWVVRDDQGHFASCVQRVNVTDNEAPTITCPGAFALECSDMGAVATFEPMARDNCGAVTTACMPPSGSKFPLGVSNDTCTATDGSGNTASCSFVVEVKDTQGPKTTVKDVLVYEDDPAFQQQIEKPAKKCGITPVLPFELVDCVTANDQCVGAVDASQLGTITRIEWWASVNSCDAGDPRKVAAAIAEAQHRIDGAGCEKFALTGTDSANLPFDELDDPADRAGFYRVYFNLADGGGNTTAASCRVLLLDGAKPGAGNDHGDHAAPGGDDHGDDDHGDDAAADHGDHGGGGGACNANTSVPAGCAVCVGTGCNTCPAPSAVCKSAQRCSELETKCKQTGKDCDKYVAQCTDTCRPQRKCLATQLRCTATGKDCDKVAKACQ